MREYEENVFYGIILTQVDSYGFIKTLIKEIVYDQKEEAKEVPKYDIYVVERWRKRRTSKSNERMEVSGMVGVCLGDLDSIEVLKIFASSGCLVICDVTKNWLCY